jgi:hypothetical protein
MSRSIAWSFLTALLLGPFAPSSAQVDIGSLDEAVKKRTPVQQPSLKQQGAPGARSAQGDCVREANRRGFAVLDTSNYQQFRDGWSIDLRVRDARGQAQQGSCFVETKTGDVDLYGFGWGWQDGGDDRFQFNCSSVDGKPRECQMPTDGRARLVKRRSDSPCTEGSTWGQRGDRVWVRDGCRAKFEVVRRGGSSSGGNTIDCASDNGRYRECAIGPGRFGRLVREYSSGRCREDRTWGTRNGVIWVTEGCRGRFEVRRGNGNGNGNAGIGGGSMSRDEAKRACAGEVERFGHKVTDASTPILSGGEYRTTLKIRAVSGEQRTIGCRIDASTGKVRIAW